MKNHHVVLLALCGCCGAWSCDDEQSPDTKSAWLTAEQIEKNSILLDSAFSLTIKALKGADKIKKLATAAESEEDFIRQMDRLTNDVFAESIERAWKIESEPYHNPKYNAARLMSYNLSTQLVDPLRAYASDIEDDAAGRNGHEDEIDVHGVSFSHDDVVDALEVFELVMEHDDPESLDDAIDDFYAEHHAPILIGLLLPAVQAARQAAVRRYGRNYIDYVMTDVIITSNQAALLTQQQKAAGYLGGLDLLISGDFKKDSEMAVCLETMRAIHLNTTAQLWHQVWKAYHE